MLNNLKILFLTLRAIAKTPFIQDLFIGLYRRYVLGSETAALVESAAGVGSLKGL